jgi:hypothetical protein
MTTTEIDHEIDSEHVDPRIKTMMKNVVTVARLGAVYGVKFISAYRIIRDAETRTQSPPKQRLSLSGRVHNRNQRNEESATQTCHNGPSRCFRLTQLACWHFCPTVVFLPRPHEAVALRYERHIDRGGNGVLFVGTAP